jgi:nucleotide-binding universal stress UspA family protein
MFTHLLVALDGSRHAESVLPYAIDLAKRVNAEVTLVRIVPRNIAEVSEWGAVGRRRAEPQAQPTVESSAAERYLDHVAANHRHFGVTVNTELRHGDPAAELLRAAEELGADTIAIATHSRRGLDRLMFGSVAERVVHGTTLPVILLSWSVAA